MLGCEILCRSYANESKHKLKIFHFMYPLQRFFHRVLVLFFSLLISITVLGCFAYLFLDSQLPDVQALKSVQLPIPLRVYTRDGMLLAEFGELRREPIPLKQVPPIMIKAILSIEDQRFYEHSGVDLIGLVRAGAQLLMTGAKTQGGSTITMQVARNFYLSRKKTFVRKLTEILLALKIERELTKDEILELYLNKIYLGNRAYGVGAAAQVYFGKPLNQLTLPEMATIAGLPKAPSTLNPIANPSGAIDRRDHVLERMFDLGYINKKDYEDAIKTPLDAVYHGETIPIHAPYVAEMVRNMMMTSFGDETYTKGYNVYTTIPSHLQLEANQSLRNALIAYDRRHGYRGSEGNLGIPNPNNTKVWIETLVRTPSVNGLKPAIVMDLTNDSVTALLADGSQIKIPWQGLAWAKRQLKNGWAGGLPRSAEDVVELGDIIRVQKNEDGKWELGQIPGVEGALVALDPNTGAIQALVGGFDFQRNKYNHVIQMKRQPGSGFKPFIYSAALAKGYTLASVFNDSPISFYIPTQGVWAPQNDDHKFNGPTRLRMALAHSRNVISVRLLQAIGVPYALKFVGRFGFDPKQLPRNMSFALGTGEVTPLEMVRGFSTFANGGYRVTPYIIDHITDSHNHVIYQSAPKIACTQCTTAENPNQTPKSDSKGTQYAPQAIPPQIAFLMTSALQDVIKLGTGRAALVLNRGDIAGKTGTTSDQVDAWFNGFNSDLAATAWVGFNLPAPLHEYGAQAALPMWIDFMRVALGDKPEHTMAQPEGIVSAMINPYTGYRQRWGGVPEYFRSDDVPEEEADTPDSNDPNANTIVDENGNVYNVNSNDNANNNGNNNPNYQQPGFW